VLLCSPDLILPRCSQGPHPARFRKAQDEKLKKVEPQAVCPVVLALRLMLAAIAVWLTYTIRLVNSDAFHSRCGAKLTTVQNEFECLQPVCSQASHWPAVTAQEPFGPSAQRLFTEESCHTAILQGVKPSSPLVQLSSL
jgi:hypothetical protein